MHVAAPLEQNRLLASLPRCEYARLMCDLEPVRLEANRVLVVPGVPIGHVYFLRKAVVSLLVAMQDGSTIEGATVGNEGLVGLALFLGETTANESMVVQITGEAARMSAAAFHEALGHCAGLRLLLHRYTLALMNQLARTAGCNRLHSVHQRCSRWLLMSDDRLSGETIPITHECLAVLLGTRRASVSEAAEILRRAGLIEYRRGQISILDRAGLERAACEDYRMSKHAYDDNHGWV